MRDLIKMVVVLTVICAGSGFLLAYVHDVTQEPREYQLIKYVKEPSIKAVLPEFDNDPVKERMTIELGKDDKGNPIEKTIFPGKKGGKIVAVAYDSTAAGYKGPIDIMVGVNPDGKLTAISIMTLKETPGLGTRITEPAFTDQFKGMEVAGQIKFPSDGGTINAVSGATYSSKGATEAVRKAIEMFPQIKKEVF